LDVARWRQTYSISDTFIQEPLVYGRGAATATARERLNTLLHIRILGLICKKIDVEYYMYPKKLAAH